MLEARWRFWWKPIWCRETITTNYCLPVISARITTLSRWPLARTLVEGHLYTIYSAALFDFSICTRSSCSDSNTREMKRFLVRSRLYWTPQCCLSIIVPRTQAPIKGRRETDVRTAGTTQFDISPLPRKRLCETFVSTKNRLWSFHLGREREIWPTLSRHIRG